jgi:hypothetical protein
VKRKDDGLTSAASNVTVLSTTSPVISSLLPANVGGPHNPFELKVRGSNFTKHSVIQVNGKTVETMFVSVKALKTTVKADVSRVIGTYNVQVVDNEGNGTPSNVSVLTMYGPVVSSIVLAKDNLVAGTGRFKMELHGKNFRKGARVLINGELVGKAHVRRPDRIRMRLHVPGKFNSAQGAIPLQVQNPDGALSPPVTFTAEGPEIDSLNPASLIAGTSDNRVEIFGSFFRDNLHVTIQNSAGEVFTPTGDQVRFITKHRIIVKLEGNLNSLTSEPDTLNFTVVNPGKFTSAPQPLAVSAPNITAVNITKDKEDSADEKMTIVGTSFAQGAVIDFIMSGQVQLERSPELTKPDKLVLFIRKSKITALGSGYQVQVINPGKIPSNQFAPP